MYTKKVGRSWSLSSLVVDGDGGNALTLPFLTGARQRFRHGRKQHEQGAAHEIERPLHFRVVSTSRIPRTQEHVRVSQGRLAAKRRGS